MKKEINLDTASIDELKIAVYDVLAERNNYQAMINELNKQIEMLNQVIIKKSNELTNKQNNEKSEIPTE